jgi:hypothetical protein
VGLGVSVSPSPVLPLGLLCSRGGASAGGGPRWDEAWKPLPSPSFMRVDARGFGDRSWLPRASLGGWNPQR